MKTTLPLLLILLPVTVFASRETAQPADTDYKYHSAELSKIEDANRELLKTMPEGEMIAGTVVATTRITLSVSTSNFLKLVASVPLSVAPNSDAFENTANDKIPALRVEIKVNTQARFGNARSDADNRVISVYVPVNEIPDYSVGTPVIVGRTIRQVTLHAMTPDELKAYTKTITPDETRMSTEDSRAAGRELAAQAKAAMTQRLYSGIANGTIKLTPQQLDELNSPQGLSSQTQTQLLAQLH